MYTGCGVCAESNKNPASVQMASLARSRRIGAAKIDDPIIAQQPQVMNCRQDPMIYDIRAANAHMSKVLVHSQIDDPNSRVLEVCYPVFTRLASLGPERRGNGPFPLVFNDLRGETEIDRAQRVFVGMPFATTSTGPGYRGEDAHKIPTVAVLVAGLAPALCNYEPFTAGCMVRVADPHTRLHGGYDVDVFQSPTMSLRGRVHGTFRVATKPSFKNPDACGDHHLATTIKLVNRWFTGAHTDDDVTSWLNLLNKYSSPGAFDAQMLKDLDRARDECIPQLLCDAVRAEYNKTIVGTCDRNVVPGDQFGLVFGN